MRVYQGSGTHLQMSLIAILAIALLTARAVQFMSFANAVVAACCLAACAQMLTIQAAAHAVL
jgi:hypothetical protein